MATKLVSKYVCPSCYTPIDPPKLKQDARCFECKSDKEQLPVNYLRPVKSKEEDEDE
jgi:hypothetical protein